MRVVLDTCVVVSAVRSSLGASYALLELIADRRLTLLASLGLFLEYEDVLKRPEQRTVSGLSLDQIDTLLARLADGIEFVDVHFTWRPQLTDPDDELVFDTAINGGADALVTFNVVDFRRASPRFGLKVLTPGAVLERLG